MIYNTKIGILMLLLYVYKIIIIIYIKKYVITILQILLKQIKEVWGMVNGFIMSRSLTVKFCYIGNTQIRDNWANLKKLFRIQQRVCYFFRLYDVT